MKSLSKKFLCLLLAAIMLLSITACGPKDPTPSTPAESSGSGESQTTDESKPSTDVKLPIVDEPKEISIWYALQANQVAAGITDLNEVTAVKELQKRTNISVDWQMGNVSSQEDQFSLMLASGKLPDAFLWFSRSTEVSRLLSEGAILELSDLIKQYAPNIQKFLDDNPTVKDSMVGPNGEIYYIPCTRPGDGRAGVYGTLTIRRDWLDKLGLKVPSTPDELYTVLKAFKEKDPNGNGKADEIPLCFQGKIKNNSVAFNAFFMWPFGIKFDFMQVDGKVTFGPYMDAYKDAIGYAHKLMADGLIDPDFATQNGPQTEKKIAANLGGCSQGRMHIKCTQIKDQLKDTVPEYDMWVMPFLKNEDGNTYYFYTDPNVATVDNLALYISSTSKNVEELLRWMDYQFTKEGGLLMTYGLEGENYTMEEGKPVFRTDLMKDESGLLITSLRSKYTLCGPGVNMWPCNVPPITKINGKWPEELITVAGSQELFDASLSCVKDTNVSRLLPIGLTLNEEEREILGDRMSDISIYIEQTAYKFMTGEESLDNFAAYQEQLKKMGIEECIAAYQSALDRFNDR